MLIAAFFRCIYIPFHSMHFFFNFFFINIVKCDLIFFQHCDFFILNIENISCVFQDRRHIGSDQIAFFSFSHYERAVFSKGKQLIREIFKQDSQGVGTVNTVHYFCNGIQRIAVIIVIQQMGHYFRICIRYKMIASGCQHLF